VHYVAVCQDKTILREDKTGTGTLRLPWAAGIHKLPPLRCLANLNIDDRRADFLSRRGDRFRIGIEKVVIRIVRQFRYRFIRCFKNIVRFILRYPF
jgi:hypothetical protein